MGAESYYHSHTSGTQYDSSYSRSTTWRSPKIVTHEFTGHRRARGDKSCVRDATGRYVTKRKNLRDDFWYDRLKTFTKDQYRATRKAKKHAAAAARKISKGSDKQRRRRFAKRFHK